MLNNFFTVADLNYAILALFSAGYLLTIQNKSKNLYHLIIFLLFLGIMSLTYFVSSNFVDEFFRFHRWITVSGALLGTLHLFYFVVNYPKSNWKKIPKFLFYFLYLIDLAAIFLFVKESLGVGSVYRFDGHFWDIDEYKLSQIVGLLIVLNGFLAFFSGIIRSFLIRNARLSLFLLSIGVLLTVIIPAITNFLNRIFLINRVEHQNIWAIFGNIGCFIIFVSYISYTKEKTTLLSKLYAISLTSILIILQFVNFYILRERDELFDLIQYEKNRNLILDKNYKPEEVKTVYIIEPSLDFVVYKGDEDENITNDLKRIKNEFALMYFQFYLLNNNLPKSIYSNLGGYSRLIEENKASLRTNQEILSFLYKNKRKIQMFKQNIQNIPEKDFEKQFKVLYLKTQQDNILRFFLKENLNNKQEALELIPDLIPFNKKKFIYIKGDSFWDFTYVGYYYAFDQKIYLILYKYHFYRVFISQIADILFYIIVFGIILIILGYPIFFFESVIKPLRSLVMGLQKVDEGDFSIHLEIFTNDEIGYVTRSFNQMVVSIREKNEKLEEYANHLEEKVKERTKELEESLQKIESLKEKQDGDYFLTSLLVRPLSSNAIQNSENIKVDFIIKQYKNFKFKKWASEIGGDFCKARKISLRDKVYSFIVNADAMGKSIQGAGGALILGSVLEAIVERTNYQEEVRELLPEKWLKYAFVELHKVFEGLNGAMLISLVMLLVDEESGLLYYMNAEHPDIILYRDGKASFIKPNKYLKKLGLYAEGLLSISMFQLKPKDVIFIGSDGKDDILIQRNEVGNRVINTDENLFLDIIEKSYGNLDHIYNTLLEKGEIIDDLSIIRMEYSIEPKQFYKRNAILIRDKENFINAKNNLELYKNTENIEYLHKAEEILIELYKNYPENLQIQKKLYKVYLLQNKINDVISILEKFFQKYPADSDVLYKLTKLLKKKRLYLKAAEYGEIYLLRNPESKEIMLLLLSIYREMNHPRYKKYEKLLEVIN